MLTRYDSKYITLPNCLQIKEAFEPTLPPCLQTPLPALKQGFPFLKLFERRIPRPVQASLHSCVSVTSDPVGHRLIPCSRK